MHILKEEKKSSSWTFKHTKLLIEQRLKYENEVSSHKINKNTLWYKVWNDVREIDSKFPFTRIAMNRKFNNLLLTFKRVKQRNLEAGRNVSKWEYYKIFHSAYSTKLINNTAQDPLMSTLGSESEDKNTSTEEDLGSINKNKTQRIQTYSNNEILDFLKKEAVEDERRHQELLKLETERIKILKSVKDLLERTLSKQ